MTLNFFRVKDLKLIREIVTIETSDLFEIKGLLLKPESIPIKATVLVLPGIGIRTKHYECFANYLLEVGFQVLIIEYRGVGDSYVRDLPLSDASLTVWAKLDACAAFNYILNNTGRKPLVFGHSFGGQVLCLCDDFSEDSGAVIVASQSGYWRHWSKSKKDTLKVFMFWYFYLPIVSLFGKYTLSTPILRTKIPCGVALEWAKWGRHKDYMRGYDKEVLKRLRKRRSVIKAYAFTDDIYAPPEAAKELWSWFPNEIISGTILSPADVKVDKIGHFNAFKEEFKNKLWIKWRNDLIDML